MNKNTKEIITILNKCPYWTLNNKNNELIILRKINIICKYPYRDIKSAVFEYVKRDDVKYNIDKISIIYLLNRYLFKIPHYVSSKNKRFSSFLWIPISNGCVDEIWPLSIDNRNNFKIIGRFHGYSGPMYSAMEEFDYFSNKYGLRKFEK